MIARVLQLSALALLCLGDPAVAGTVLRGAGVAPAAGRLDSPNSQAVARLSGAIGGRSRSPAFEAWSGPGAARPTGTVNVPGAPSARTFDLRFRGANPFRDRTSVEYSLPSAATVRLAVFDARGRRVRSLASGFHEAGLHAATWDGRDDRGESVGSGVYFARLAAGAEILSRRVILRR